MKQSLKNKSSALKESIDSILSMNWMLRGIVVELETLHVIPCPREPSL